MQDQPNNPEIRAAQLDQEVARLTSEVTSLKLELATLISAVHEIQAQQLGRRLPARIPAVAPQRTPSAVPAGVVALAFSGLLTWQLVTSSRQVEPPQPVVMAAAFLPAPVRLVGAVAPVVPFPVPPVIYRGTLSVNADQPEAHVFVNREMVGTAPVHVPNLRAGSHLVWIESEGHRRWTRVITVPAEKVTRVSAALEPIEPVEQNPQ